MHLPTSPLQRLLAITASLLACATPAQALVDVISYSGTDGASNAWGYNDGRYSGQRVDGWLSGGEGDLTDGLKNVMVGYGYANWRPM